MKTKYFRKKKTIPMHLHLNLNQERKKTMNKITMKTIKANREKFVLCDWCGAEYDPFKSAVLDAAITLSNGKARASKPVIKAIREFGFPIYNKRKG